MKQPYPVGTKTSRGVIFDVTEPIEGVYLYQMDNGKFFGGLEFYVLYQ